MKDQVLLFSGGLDSTIAYFYLGKPDLLYFRLNHNYANEEYETVLWFKHWEKNGINLMPNLEISDLLINYGNLEQKDTAYIPMRNLMLASTAAAMGYSKIMLAINKGEDGLTDRTPKFFKQLSELLSFIEGREITVIAVMNEYTKSTALSWFLSKENNVPSELTPAQVVLETFSCFFPNRNTSQINCGACKACVRTFIAFIAANFDYDLPWAKIAFDSQSFKEYVHRAKSGNIHPERGREILYVGRHYKNVR